MFLSADFSGICVLLASLKSLSCNGELCFYFQMHVSIDCGLFFCFEFLLFCLVEKVKGGYSFAPASNINCLHDLLETKKMLLPQEYFT